MASPESSDVAAVRPSADEVRIQLERILTSELFHLPERAGNFLRYVVEETLAGRSQYLKAYAIAEVVYGRRNFDPQNDPVVRIEAGRIRRELERYYLITGAAEPVIITIPKGGYIPIFETSSSFRVDEVEQSSETQPLPSADLDAPPYEVVAVPAAHKAGYSRLLLAGAATVAVILAASTILGVAPHAKQAIDTDNRLTIAVDRFEDIGSDSQSSGISQGVTDEILSKLVKFKEIVVVDSTANDQDAAERVKTARYALQGSVRQNGDRIRSTARLVRRSDGAIVWANNYDYDLAVQDMFEVESALAEKIATAVAQPFGIVFQARISANGLGGWDAYDCSLSYYNYRKVMTMPALGSAQECLKSVIEKFPKDATSLAFLSLTYLDQVRFPYKLGAKPSPKTLETATELAEKATAIDPQNARALQAMMLTSFFRKDVDDALKEGAAAYQLNPNDTEVTGEYGLRLSMSGRWETGCDLVSNAVSKNAGPQGYFEVGMALCAFMRGDLRAAELWSRMSDLNYNPMHRVVLASILGASGKVDQAKKELEWIGAKAPALMSSIRREISMRLMRPQDQERIFNGLRAAGTQIDPGPPAN